MMVEVVRMPSRWAVVTTSSHWRVEMRPFEMTLRTSSSRISAEVPGRVPSPASRSSARYSRIDSPDRVTPYSTSSGEKAWMWRSGSARLMARQRSM
jgi:hypothetical protein